MGKLIAGVEAADVPWDASVNIGYEAGDFRKLLFIIILIGNQQSG
jgi:hypothetical protein